MESAGTFRTSPLWRYVCFRANGLNRSRGRALRRAAWPCQQWMERWERLILPDDEGPEAYPQEPTIVSMISRDLSSTALGAHRDRSETASASRTVRIHRTDAIGDAVMIASGYKASSKQFRWTLSREIFVRPMRYKGCHQAHHAKVAICALFTTRNFFELQDGERFVFTHSQSSCHIAKVVLAFRHDSRQIPIGV